MTKIKVDEIEALSTNQNVEIKTNNTGALEVQGGTNDGTLQLNCSAQSHGVKLKSPPNSAGQNYTMVLPDNQIAASKFLKVKSVTGNVGQLEYGDAPVADLTNLNANNLTAGTLPTARFSIPATSGAGLKLISETVVPNDNSVTQLNFTGLEVDSIYKMVVKNMQFSNNNYPVMEMFNGGTGGTGNGATMGYVMYNRYCAYSSSWYTETGGSNSWNATSIPFNATRWSSSQDGHAAVCLISTGSGVEGASWQPGQWSWIRWVGHYMGVEDSWVETYASTAIQQNHWLGSVRLQPSTGGTYFQQNTRVLLYKFMES
tara:strand:+ start:294 stop:1238 length:945 start_codon:yes stop_codon:yes gene_type:complete